MKRSIEALVVVPMVLVIAAMAILGLCGIARAEPAQQFGFPVVAGVHAMATESFVSDPTPDGLFGIKMVIYTGPINGFQVSIAEVDATAHALELQKDTCLTRDRGGRCVRRQREDTSLYEVPSLAVRHVRGSHCDRVALIRRREVVPHV